MDAIVKSFYNIIRTVVREHKWSPDIIGDLFYDNDDYHGIKFWADDIRDLHEQLKPIKKT